MKHTSSVKPILVIDPATNHPELSCYELIAELSPAPVLYSLPALTPIACIKLWENLHSLAGIIILGSASSVYDTSAWASHLKNFISQHIDSRTPIFGLCYGHQLIVDLFKGSMKTLSQKQQGLRRVSIESTSIFTTSPFSGSVIVSHIETIDQPPQELLPWLTSEGFPYDGLYHPHRPIWTAQPHLEGTLGFCKNQDIDIKKDFSNSFGKNCLKQFLLQCNYR